MKTIRMICYPILAMTFFQLGWNVVAAFYLGNFQSSIGDWIYSRDCDRTAACGGARLILLMWCATFGASIGVGLAHGALWLLSSHKGSDHV